MSFNQESKPRNIYLIQSLKGRYVPYPTKPKPVYSQKYDDNNCAEEKNLDLEKPCNLNDEDPLSVETLRRQLQQRMDNRGTPDCPPWVEGCLSVLCCCCLLGGSDPPGLLTIQELT